MRRSIATRGAEFVRFFNSCARVTVAPTCGSELRRSVLHFFIISAYIQMALLTIYLLLRIIIIINN